MSGHPLANHPPSNFDSIFRTAFKAYKKRTGQEITSHPLATWLNTCDSPDAILAVLRAQVDEFDQSRRDNERLTKWLNPTVNVLYAFSATLGVLPAKVIFAGIGVLLLASKDVAASHDVLIDIFERIENFFKRLAAYTPVPQTAAMTNIIVKIMVEVLSIFAIATKEIKQGRAKKFVKKLVGRRDIEDALERLDRLTQEEAWMANAEVPRLTHSVDDKVNSVSFQVEGIKKMVQGIDGKVDCVDERVQGVDEGVHGICEGVQRVSHKVQAVDDRVRQVNDRVGVVNNDVKLIVEGNQLRRDLRNWISPPDPSINYNTACGAHHEGTAAWLTRGDAFKGWRTDGCLLWVHGKQIEDICNAGLASMAYFYFDFKDTGKQDSHALLSSLLIQLSHQSDVYCDILHALYSSHRQGSVQLNDDALTQCLKTMLVALGQTPIYLILDAVDECPNASGIPSPREKVLILVKELVELKLSNLHLCITSRPEVDIRNVLEPLAAHRISLHDESGQNADIANYVSSVVYSDSRMRRWRAEERDVVVGTLSAKADGMFRWVFCQLEILRHCFPSSVLNILDQLPESLDETYERILREISRANRLHACRLLQCLTVAVRPLRVEELAEVLAVDFNASGGPKLNADWRWEDNEEAVLSACSSLVAVVMDSHSRVIQFSHFSVKEFLTSNRLASSLGEESQFHIRLESAHTILAQASLGVLLRLDEQVDRDSIVGYSLAKYAAEHWPEHVKFENVLSHVKDGIDELFDADKPHFAAWLWLHDVDGSSMARTTTPSQPEAPPLYYAVLIGNRALVERVLSKRPQDVNVKGGYSGTPLHAAFSERDIETVWLLLENGADVNIRGYEDRTPLHCTSAGNGFFDVTRWLLRRGVDVTAEDEDQWTALHYAALNGRPEVAGILLEHNAEVNKSEYTGRVPLHIAAEYGHLELARLLLKHGGNSNARTMFGKTPADEARARGHTEIIELLSEHYLTFEVVMEVGERDEFNTIVEQYGNYYWSCTPYPSHSPFVMRYEHGTGITRPDPTNLVVKIELPFAELHWRAPTKTLGDAVARLVELAHEFALRIRGYSASSCAFGPVDDSRWTHQRILERRRHVTRAGPKPRYGERARPYREHGRGERQEPRCSRSACFASRGVVLFWDGWRPWGVADSWSAIWRREYERGHARGGVGPGGRGNVRRAGHEVDGPAAEERDLPGTRSATSGRTRGIDSGDVSVGFPSELFFLVSNNGRGRARLCRWTVQSTHQLTVTRPVAIKRTRSLGVNGAKTDLSPVAEDILPKSGKNLASEDGEQFGHARHRSFLYASAGIKANNNGGPTPMLVCAENTEWRPRDNTHWPAAYGSPVPSSGDAYRIRLRPSNGRVCVGIDGPLRATCAREVGRSGSMRYEQRTQQGPKKSYAPSHPAVATIHDELFVMSARKCILSLEKSTDLLKGDEREDSDKERDEGQTGGEREAVEIGEYGPDVNEEPDCGGHAGDDQHAFVDVEEVAV
ncbi:hypothetical protein EDB89DRAFT_1902103 [Lactarius sanguifluus]|nr:hypothetical protein EDB89DRAFT_1902103 [Lactarius sanguifluus]